MTGDVETHRHCDDYIDDETQPRVLRAFLYFNRLPAIEQGKIGGDGPALYARHKSTGEIVRVVMASRFGDVGITPDLRYARGYSKRVWIDELTDFGNAVSIITQDHDQDVIYGYMCTTDWEYELGNASGGNKVYSSVGDIKECSECCESCGITEVKVTFSRTIQEPEEDV